MPNWLIRILIAAVLIPAILWLTHQSTGIFGLGVLGFGVVAMIEWSRLVLGHGYHTYGQFLLALPVLSYFNQLSPTLSLIAAALGGVSSIGIAQIARMPMGRFSLYLVGCWYIAAAFIALAYLQSAHVPMLWLLLVVTWATDTGAYIVGSLLRGPLLAPGISPQKTWSGAIGGVIVAIGATYVLQRWVMIPVAPMKLPLLVAALSVIGQVGDLLESKVKRWAGVKDSGELIPGHGGVLDRVDSLLAGAIVLAASLWLRP